MTKRHSARNPRAFDSGGDRTNDLFAALSDSRRRFVLHSLETAGRPISIDELAADIAAWDDRQSESERSGSEANAIEVSLVHTHLPMLAEAGLVEYDDTRQTVGTADRTSEASDHLEAVAGGRR